MHAALKYTLADLGNAAQNLLILSSRYVKMITEMINLGSIGTFKKRSKRLVGLFNIGCGESVMYLNRGNVILVNQAKILLDHD